MLDSSSPLEALTLNYAGFGLFTVVNNLWTWVAVITAGISFWRIRATSFSDKPDHHQQHRIDRNTSGSQVNPSSTNAYVETLAKSPSPAAAPIPALLSACEVKAVDGVTEGSKFTLYCYKEEEEEEEERECDGGDGDGEVMVVKEWRDDDGDNSVSCGEWWERVTMRARIGDMGWYRYQELTVVNGNVVRLWD